MSERISIGIDIGGTFTDVVGLDGAGVIRLFKIPTTTGDPSAAVREALATMRERWGFGVDLVCRVTHGTTVATNAVLERKGGKVGLLATAGFTDVLEIGRSFRRNIYDLAVQSAAPGFLVPRHLRRGVVERMSSRGEVLTPLCPRSLAEGVGALLQKGVDAIAVAFLFSYANPAHEREAARVIAELAPGMMVSLSCDIDPAFREFERTSVTAFDAYVKPVLDRYLATMEHDLAEHRISAPLQVMQSRGGLAASVVARRRPVRLFLSGPAAGVIGGHAVGRGVGRDDLITCDIGGTSCDIALIRHGMPLIRPEGVIDGYPVRVPMVDVNAIGAGGGSIAWIDGAGGLRVGPQSAGSNPGPACYGRGGSDATVSDAAVVLGYLNPDYFAGGSMRLEAGLAAAAIEETVARPLGLSLREAALGIRRVVNAQMAEGIRLVSVRRGFDPRSASLVCFGGAGPLHATALADELGIEQIVVPRFPGVLSACGLLWAPTEHEVSIACHLDFTGLQPEVVRAALAELDGRCDELMAAEALDGQPYRIWHEADVCYIGQSHAIEISLADARDDMLQQLYEDFLDAHNQLYGHGTALPARVVNLRAAARTEPATATGAADRVPAGRPALKETREIVLAGGTTPVKAQVFERDALAPGTTITAPAIIEQPDTTTLIEPPWRAVVGADGTLLLARS